MPFPNRPDQIHAHVRFTNANPPVVTAADGIASVARTGAGDYLVTLSNAIDILAANIQGTAAHNAAAIITVVHASDTTIQVLVWDAAGMALEAGSTLLTVFRVNSL